MCLCRNTTQIPQLNGNSNKTMASSRQVTQSVLLLNVVHPRPFSPSLWVCLPVTSSSQKILQKPQEHKRSHDAASCARRRQQQTGHFIEKMSNLALMVVLVLQPVHSTRASSTVCVCAASHPVYTAWLLLPDVNKSNFQSEPYFTFHSNLCD